MTGWANTHYSALAAWPDGLPSPQPDIGVPLSSIADLDTCCFCAKLPLYIHATTYKTGGILLAPPPALFFFSLPQILIIFFFFFSTSVLLHSFVFSRYPLLDIVKDKRDWVHLWAAVIQSFFMYFLE